MTEPVPLEKDQIPFKASDTPQPLREEQIPAISASTTLAHASLPATTTAEQQISYAGQRFINRIWESMQAFIAGLVVVSGLYVSIRLSLLYLIPEATEQQQTVAYAAFIVISNLVSNIVGFYFGRTNHQRTGGTGSNPSSVEGR